MAARKTSLYGVHERLGARIIDFHGWMMPVQYKGVVEEHLCVREKAGLFDVSHMGEFMVSGPGATEAVNRVVTNDVSRIADGQCLYTPMCYENGTIVDDLIVYRHDSGRYMLVVNASNIEKDYGWIKSKMAGDGDVSLKDASDDTAMLALQGPKAEAILRKAVNIKLKEIGRFRFKDEVMVCGVKALVSRTGYTGEDGFELYVDSGDAVGVWDSIMDAGKKQGLQPIGLGARDTLRLEAGLMLYGNDIDDTTTPLEAGLGWTVKRDKKEFTGRDALLRQKAAGVGKRLVGFELVDRGVPRHGYEIRSGSESVGRVTSGTYSPTLRRSIGMGYVKPECGEVGTAFDVVIRDTPHKAKVVALPFYRR